MKAWILDESPGSYRLGEIEMPPLGADDVRIRVVASALNHMDLWVTRGQPRPPLPHVPGCDVAGVVTDVGPAVTNIAVGSTMGSYEEFDQVSGLVAQGLDVHVDSVLDLDDYPAALQRLERGAQLGKLVLRHPGPRSV